jgi:hypothetical protein
MVEKKIWLFLFEILVIKTWFAFEDMMETPHNKKSCYFSSLQTWVWVSKMYKKNISWGRNRFIIEFPCQIQN